MLVKFRRSVRENAPLIVIAILFSLFMMAFLSPRIFITIPAGYEGVIFRKFFGGTVIDRTYKEGLRVFFPWDTVIPYCLREQVLDVDLDALTSDGMNVQVRITVRFQLKPRLLGVLHKTHGPDYIRTYLTPEVESSTRQILGKAKPVELYSTARNLLEMEIFSYLDNELREFDDFENLVWPKPPANSLFLGEVGHRTDEGENVRLLLKHLYEVEADNLQLIDDVKKEGFINLFREFYHSEQKIERDRVLLTEQISKLQDEREVIESSLEMHFVRGEMEKDEAQLNVVILDSLNTLFHELEQASAKLDEKSVNGNDQFGHLRDAYDQFFTVIHLKDVLISSIVLPDKIRNAIESKLQQEQIAEEFDFRLERERKEAERKRIEARGIKDFQDMVAAGIEEGLLKWKAIEATLELAKSNNAKMVIIGAGKEGLPIILGNQGWDFPVPSHIDSVNGAERATSREDDSMQ